VEHGRQTVELRRVEPDRISDLEADDRLVSDQLDHLAASRDPVVPHQRLGDQLDLLGRVVAPAGEERTRWTAKRSIDRVR